ncbi:hypothetical protein C3L33_19523, partial [Rhododendron williamsianum]
MADVEYRCFVGGLAWATDDHSLEQAFSQYGDVIESKIINDRETGRSRGFGFVTFKDEQSMKDAIEGMNGQDLDGRNITVNEAQSRGSGGEAAGRWIPQRWRWGGGRRDGGGYGGGGGGYGGSRSGGGGVVVMEAVVVDMEAVAGIGTVGPGTRRGQVVMVEAGGVRFL